MGSPPRRPGRAGGRRPGRWSPSADRARCRSSGWDRWRSPSRRPGAGPWPCRGWRTAPAWAVPFAVQTTDWPAARSSAGSSPFPLIIGHHEPGHRGRSRVGHRSRSRSRRPRHEGRAGGQVGVLAVGRLLQEQRLAEVVAGVGGADLTFVGKRRGDVADVGILAPPERCRSPCRSSRRRAPEWCPGRRPRRPGRR